MKNQKKQIKYFILLILTCVLVHGNMVYASPNSSKGFAEYDDVKAEEENKGKQEEQRKEQEAAIGKSTNNYLENLVVEGYEISPTFDKQTIDYVITEKIKSNEITILATPSDEKAKVEGSGKITLEANQKQCRIDVIAESGTVRTYQIYLEEQAKNEYQNQNQTEITNSEAVIEKSEEVVEENKKEKNFIAETILAIGMVIIIIAFIIRAKLKNKRKA